MARTHGWADPGVRVLAAALDGLHRFADGEPERARALLAWVVAQGVGDLPTHPFVTRYLAGRTWPVEIAGGVVAHLGLADDAVLLAAAELQQAAATTTRPASRSRRRCGRGPAPPGCGTGRCASAPG